MPRNEVDEDWGVDCSQGLHVGSASYQFSGDVKVLVKVNPKDVVSVPSNETNKCRVCAYEIVEIYKGDFNTSVVGPQGQKINSSHEEIEECEWCGEAYCDGECVDETDL
jgi:hypothetical protein